MGGMSEGIPFVHYNFCGLEAPYNSFEEARFVLIPVPYDLTTSYMAGTRRGPMAIIEASTHLELYDEELRLETYRAGIHTLPFVEPVTSGPEGMIEVVERSCRDVVERGKIPVLIGGEHSLSLGMVRALKAIYPDLSVLHLDAHADMRDRYCGSPFNHGCVARRISELSPLVQVGVRSLSREEAEYLESSGIRTVYADEFLSGPETGIFDTLTDQVYITIDLDVFDPSIMPSVGTPEPGGPGWYEVLKVLKGAIRGRDVVGFDVVELSPIPGNVAPDFVAAKLIYRVMGYILREGRGEG